MKTYSMALAFGALCAAACGAETAYQPSIRVTGMLRSWGDEQVAPLLKKWEAGFQRLHPGVQFADSLKSTASAMYGLDLRSADMAIMGRPIFPYERYGTYEHSWLYPVGIEVATGSATLLHKSPALAVFVHRDNPLAQMTVQQLDRVFGAERAGGWNALSWDESVARTAQSNVRTWDQLGVTGPLAGQPIHVYGPPGLGAGAITFFQSRVMGGGEMWNPALQEYADRAQMVAALARDPLGIAYAPLAYATAGVKALALADKPGDPFVALSAATVAARTYPLARPVYIYYTIDNGDSELSPTRGDPRVKEFLRYILSREGQQAVADEGSFLPLPPAVIGAQLDRISSMAQPPEHELLED
jgi:phosphate transport system substrate-binding protein